MRVTDRTKSNNVISLMPLLLMLVMGAFLSAWSIIKLDTLDSAEGILSVLDLLLRIISIFLLLLYARIFLLFISAHIAFVVSVAFLIAFVCKTIDVAPELYFSAMVLFHWILMRLGLYAAENSEIDFGFIGGKKKFYKWVSYLILSTGIASIVSFIWNPTIALLIFGLLLFVKYYRGESGILG